MKPNQYIKNLQKQMPEGVVPSGSVGWFCTLCGANTLNTKNALNHDCKTTKKNFLNQIPNIGSITGGCHSQGKTTKFLGLR